MATPPRPRPYTSRRSADDELVISANTDFNRGGTGAYITYLRARTGDGILCLQEVGHGRRSVRIQAVGAAVVRRRRWREIGLLGAHRWVATARTRIASDQVRLFNAHGLHRRTAGARAQAVYLTALQARLRLLTRRRRLWILAGDLNTHPSKVASRLPGSSWVGHGVDAVIVAPGLRVELVSVDQHGIAQGWTDHPAIVARVSLA